MAGKVVAGGFNSMVDIKGRNPDTMNAESGKDLKECGLPEVIAADLHIHTFFSDGEDSPERVVKLAAAAGVRLLSITDHDTAQGTQRAVKAAREAGLEIISGIEFSCNGAGEVHILGYGMDTESPRFKSELELLREKRDLRIKKTVYRLNKLGINIDNHDIKCSESGICGRVHVARAMIKKGVATSVSDAFSRYLAYGKSAYVASDRISVEHAIGLISDCGGRSVLAHPCQLSCPQQHVSALIKSYGEMGLQGIEAGYYAHTNAEKQFYTALAARLGLFITCGSDYHGESRNSQIKAFELKKQDYLRLMGR